MDSESKDMRMHSFLSVPYLHFQLKFMGKSHLGKIHLGLGLGLQPMVVVVVVVVCMPF